MKVKWLCIVIFIFILSGCTDSKNKTMIVTNDDFKMYEKNIVRVDSIILPEMNQETILTSNVESETLLLNEDVSKVAIDQLYISADLKEDEIQSIEQFIRDVDQLQGDIITKWSIDFREMYADMIYHADGGINEEIMGSVAEKIERLHTEYRAIEKSLEHLDVPYNVPFETQEVMVQVIEEMNMAVENRTLALIEFKSMYDAEDQRAHDELLNIHVQNSDMYLDRAGRHISALAAE